MRAVEAKIAKTDKTTQKLRDKLVGIQMGTAPDPHGWVMKLD